MRRNYETIFLGCSAYAIGAAEANPDGSLILEAGEGLGGEFTDALMTGGFARPQAPGAQALYDELIARRVMSEESAARGEAHLPAVSVVLARRLRESRAHVLFKTRVLGIEGEAGRVVVRAVCNAKLYEFECARVVDTRSDDYARIRALDPTARFFLCAHVGLTAMPEGQWAGARLKRGYLPGEWYLQMETGLPSADDPAQVLRRFDARPSQFMTLRLLLLCHARGVECGRIRVQEPYGEYIPSCGFGNPMDAYAAGEQEGRRRHE